MRKHRLKQPKCTLNMCLYTNMQQIRGNSGCGTKRNTGPLVQKLVAEQDLFVGQLKSKVVGTADSQIIQPPSTPIIVQIKRQLLYSHPSKSINRTPKSRTSIQLGRTSPHCFISSGHSWPTNLKHLRSQNMSTSHTKQRRIVASLSKPNHSLRPAKVPINT